MEHSGLGHLSMELRAVADITVTSTAASLNSLWNTATGGDLRSDVKYIVLASSDLGSVHYVMSGNASAASPAFLSGLGEKGFSLSRSGADDMSLYAGSDTTVTVEVYA